MITVGKLYQFNAVELTRPKIYIRVAEDWRAYDVENTLAVVLAVVDDRPDRPGPKSEFKIDLLLPDGVRGTLLVEERWLTELGTG
jgi:hypothetical protein